MNKPFLLIAGIDYYPSKRTKDWVGCFKTREEAESKIKIRTQPVKMSKYEVEGSLYDYADWYEIVDLREWQ